MKASPTLVPYSQPFSRNAKKGPYSAGQTRAEAIRQPDRPVLPMLTCVVFCTGGINCGRISRLRSTCRLCPREHAGPRSRTPDRRANSVRRGQRIDLHRQGVGGQTPTTGTRHVPRSASRRRYSARLTARSVGTVHAAPRDLDRSTSRPEHRFPLCV